ncbi:MAG: DUF3562 domain-containing protein [Nitrospirales bacterium]
MGASMTPRLASEAKSANESKIWQRLIKRLAADLHKPETQIEAVFQSELRQLERGSRVKNFISILAARRVKESM